MKQIPIMTNLIQPSTKIMIIKLKVIINTLKLQILITEKSPILIRISIQLTTSPQLTVKFQLILKIIMVLIIQVKLKIDTDKINLILNPLIQMNHMPQLTLNPLIIRLITPTLITVITNKIIQ
jgi:hypothetical protein